MTYPKNRDKFLTDVCMHLLTKENCSALAKMPGCVCERIATAHHYVWSAMGLAKQAMDMDTRFTTWSCFASPRRRSPTADCSFIIRKTGPLICFDSNPCACGRNQKRLVDIKFIQSRLNVNGAYFPSESTKVNCTPLLTTLTTPVSEGGLLYSFQKISRAYSDDFLTQYTRQDGDVCWNENEAFYGHSAVAD